MATDISVLDVKVIKLVNGDELIARHMGGPGVSEYRYGNYVFKDIRALQFYPDGQGGVQTGLVPYLTTAPDATLSLNPDLIITTTSCPAEVEKKYNEAVSGLKLM